MHNMYKYVYNMYKYVYNMYIMDDNMVKLKLMNPVNGSMGIMGIYIYNYGMVKLFYTSCLSGCS